jgi:hypothetical protein
MLFAGWRQHGFLADLDGPAAKIDRFRRGDATVEVATGHMKEGLGFSP